MLSIGLHAGRWELAGRFVPVIDSRLFIPPQHSADFFSNPPRTRRLRLQQPGKHLTHLRHRQRGRFFSSRRFSRITNHNANSDSVMWWCQPTQLRTS